MVGWWGRKKEEDKLVAVINIGAAAVNGGLLFLPNKHNLGATSSLPRYLVEETITFDLPAEKLSLPYYLKSVFTALDQIIAKLNQASEKMGQPNSVTFFLPSLLVLAQTRSIHLKDEHKIKINEEIINDLALDAGEKLLAQHPSIFQELPHDRSVILEQDILSAQADGYDLPLYPQGEAKELVVVTRLILSSRDFIRGLKERARRLKPNRPEIMIKTFISAVAPILTESDLLIIDPSGNVTDFVIVKNKKILAEGSFPLGEGGLISSLSQKLKTGKSVARSLLSLKEAKVLAAAPTRTLTTATEAFRRQWLTALKKSLSVALGVDFLPATLYLSGGGGATDALFIDWLKRDGLDKLTVSRREPTVLPLANPLWLLASFCDKIKSEL